MDNIRFGRPDASDEEVIKAAEAIGANEFIEKLIQWLRNGSRGTGKCVIRR